MIAPAAVLTALASHTGAANGIRAVDLARALACSERDVRTCVSSLRLDGLAVCGTPETGYFIAATAEELEATCNFHYDRAMHSLRIVAAMKRVPLPDLKGQLRLRT